MTWKLLDIFRLSSLQNALFEESNDLSTDWLFPPSYETLTFSQSTKNSSDLDLCRKMLLKWFDRGQKLMLCIPTMWM